MNSGIQDAFLLSQTIGDALYSGADGISDLQRYSNTRRAVSLGYVNRITDENYHHSVESDSVLREKWKKEMAEIVADEQKSRRFLARASMLDVLDRAFSFDDRE